MIDAERPGRVVLLVGREGLLRTALREQLTLNGTTVIEPRVPLGNGAVRAVPRAPADAELPEGASSAALLSDPTDSVVELGRLLRLCAARLVPPGAIVLVAPPRGVTSDGADADLRAGLASLVSRLARSLGPGVRINLVQPGPWDGPRGAHLPPVLSRTGRPEDIASAVLFLLSESSRFVTGAVLAVDGGAGLRWSLDGVENAASDREPPPTDPT